MRGDQRTLRRRLRTVVEEASKFYRGAKTRCEIFAAGDTATEVLRGALQQEELYSIAERFDI
jgi:hypothetical protein